MPITRASILHRNRKAAPRPSLFLLPGVPADAQPAFDARRAGRKPSSAFIERQLRLQKEVEEEESFLEWFHSWLHSVSI